LAIFQIYGMGLGDLRYCLDAWVELEGERLRAGDLEVNLDRHFFEVEP
jgi:hypothetical protein